MFDMMYNNVVRKVNAVYLDAIIGLTGLGAWLAENWENVGYFLLFGVVVAWIRIIKFRQDLAHDKRMKQLEFEKLQDEVAYAKKLREFEILKLEKGDNNI